MPPSEDIERLSPSALKDLVLTLLVKVAELEKTLRRNATKSPVSRAGQSGRTSSRAACSERLNRNHREARR
jgi:hypothetical protein